MTVRVIRHWHRFPRAAVDSLSLEMFQTRFGWGLEQPGNSERCPCPWQRVGARRVLGSLPSQIILWFILYCKEETVGKHSIFISM